MLSFPRHPNTEVFCFFPSGKRRGFPETSRGQAENILHQLKTEVQTMVYWDTQDAALYSEKHPFSLKRRRHLNFFLNDKFHNGKVDGYLSSFSGRFLLLLSAGAAFRLTTCSEHKGSAPSKWQDPGRRTPSGGGLTETTGRRLRAAWGPMSAPLLTGSECVPPRPWVRDTSWRKPLKHPDI